MKTLTSNRILLLMALVFCQMTSKAEEVKKIHKSWPVNKVVSLSVENKFGNINFLNTRDDSVTIDVVIESVNGNEHWGSRISDLIDFNFSFEEGIIKAQTIFDDKFKTKKDFTIIYTINIPFNKNIDITNRYGDVTITDLKAKGKFKISYGNIFGNSIQAPPGEVIEIEMKYSNATFESINHLKGDISYSKLQTSNIETATFETRYSTMNIDNCKTLNSNSQYDNFIVGNIQNFKTESRFSDWKIDEIITEADLNTEYGGVNVGHVSKNFKNIRIQNRYGNIRIGIDKDASYNLFSDTRYCEVRFPKTTPTKYFKENNQIIIEAKIGNGNPLSKVNIESKYGKVDLME